MIPTCSRSATIISAVGGTLRGNRDGGTKIRGAVHLFVRLFVTVLSSVLTRVVRRRSTGEIFFEKKKIAGILTLSPCRAVPKVPANFFQTTVRASECGAVDVLSSSRRAQRRHDKTTRRRRPPHAAVPIEDENAFLRSDRTALAADPGFG